MKVVIVGGGPAGIALGRLLALGGADVDVLERAQSFDRVLRGEGLMPLGIDALAAMGHAVSVWPDWEWRAGAVDAVLVAEDGARWGGADPRRGALAIAR